MESSIAEFLVRWPACERLPTITVSDIRIAGQGTGASQLVRSMLRANNAQFPVRVRVCVRV